MQKGLERVRRLLTGAPTWVYPGGRLGLTRDLWELPRSPSAQRRHACDELRDASLQLTLYIGGARAPTSGVRSQCGRADPTSAANGKVAPDDE